MAFLIRIEEFDPGHRAINLVEPLSGRMDEMRRRWRPGRD